MSNQLPPPPIYITEPILTGTMHIGKMCKKDFKFYKKCYQGVFATGRIKQIRKYKYKGLGYWKYRTNKHILQYKLTDIVCKKIPITRWNRH